MDVTTETLAVLDMPASRTAVRTHAAAAVEPLGAADAFGARLRTGDIVVALFRGPEMSPAPVRATVIGIDGTTLRIDPLTECGPLLDGTAVAPGAELDCPAALVVLGDRTVRRPGPDTARATAGHRDGAGQVLALGDSVALPLGGAFGDHGWARGQIIACTGTALVVRADADYRIPSIERFVSAGQELRIAPAGTVRVATPA